MTGTQEPGVPFSLVCFDCDAGMEISSHDEAIANGWTEIEYAPHLSMSNYLGLCPTCRCEETGELRGESQFP